MRIAQKLLIFGLGITAAAATLGASAQTPGDTARRIKPRGGGPLLLRQCLRGVAGGLAL
jgi:hypothetical protein